MVKDSDERAAWYSMRQALLMQVDAIERLLSIEPRTCEIRRLLNTYLKSHPNRGIMIADLEPIELAEQ